jgi:arsenite oxidase large subunit
VTAVAIVTQVVKKGMLYANILDMRQPSNSLAARVIDRISGSYKYKMGVARITKIGESAYKKEGRSFSWAPRNIV